jgi:hypothetical protein
VEEYFSAAEAMGVSHSVQALSLAQYGSVNCNYAGECELGEGKWD